MFKKLTSISIFIYLITIFLLLLDAYGSETTVYKHFHIDSRNVAILSVILFILLRIFFSQKLKGFFSKVNKFLLFPLSLGLGIILTLYGYFTPPNYVYSLFHLQYTQIFLISLYSGIIILLGQSDDWFRKYYKKIIFISAFVLPTIALVVSLFPFDTFIKLSQEDNLIENVQVFVLLLAAFWGLRFLKTLFLKHSKGIHILVFGLSVLLLFLVAGDEISWGQRIFNIETPKQIAEHNLQNEITIHNLSSCGDFVNPGYIAIGLYGSIAWLFQYFRSNLKKSPFSYYIPPWFCGAFYFFGFIYNFYVKLNINHTIGNWSEFAELMLYIGIMFTMFNLIFKNHLKINHSFKIRTH